MAVWVGSSAGVVIGEPILRSPGGDPLELSGGGFIQLESARFSAGGTSWIGSPVTVEIEPLSGSFVPGVWDGDAATVEIVATSGFFSSPVVGVVCPGMRFANVLPDARWASAATGMRVAKVKPGITDYECAPILS